MRFLTPIACALALAPAAAAGPGLMVGAAEDSAKSVDLVHATSQLELARLAGLDTVRMTTIWEPGQVALADRERTALRNASAAATFTGVRIVLSVYHRGSRTTPRTVPQQAAFARFTASVARDVPGIGTFVIGNEPNLNRFWLPQFTRRGGSASPAAYAALLGRTYDALKAVSRDVVVVGGALSPRGADNPRARRQTHSPVRFLEELGRAYRASKRTRPLMDALAIHPYGLHSSTPPETANPRNRYIGLADYRKLVGVLTRAFRGTPQPGARLPIYYAEYGIQSRIPKDKAGEYTGREPATTKPVDEAVQADYYRRALLLARCQPTVKALLFFLVQDEPDLDRWQSGLLYPDGTPKWSFAAVRNTIASVRTLRPSSSFCVRMYRPKPDPAPAPRPQPPPAASTGAGTGTSTETPPPPTEPPPTEPPPTEPPPAEPPPPEPPPPPPS